MIVDGNNCLHRVCHIPMYAGARTSEGANYGGVLGFFNTLHKAIDRFLPKICVVVWDGGISQRRLSLLETYKSNRKTMREDPAKQLYFENWKEQRKHLLRLLPVAGMRCIQLEREGDDTIWAVREVLRESGDSAIIVSEDMDFGQMVDQQTSLYFPIKDVVVTLSNFTSALGVPRGRFLLFKSLLGDSGDAVPGIKDVGEVTATKVATEVESFDWEVLREHCAQAKDRRTKLIAANIDIVKRNYELVRLGREQLEEEEWGKIAEVLDTPSVQDFSELSRNFAVMEFKLLLRSFYEFCIPLKRLQ